MTQLTLNFFGKFHVKVDTIQVTGFHSDKARALLAYLALEPQEQARSVLATLFWPGIDDQYARTNLRTTLYRLRQTLDGAMPGTGDRLLTITRQTVMFNSDNCTVDTLRFQALLSQQSIASPPTLDHLAEAVALYQGELLLGFGVADAEPFEEWLLLHRELFHQQAVLAFHMLTTAHENASRYEQAFSISDRLLTLDPYREETYRQRMRLLARMGQPHQALHQLEQLRRVFREEMGVNPSPETLLLAEQIIAGKFDKLARSSVEGMIAGQARPEHSRSNGEIASAQSSIPSSSHPVIPSSSQLVTSAPDLRDIPNPGSFFGRVRERKQLTKWLLHDRCRVVAILGIGGMGKTTLAAQFVRALAGETADGNAHQAGFAAVLWRSLVNAPPLDELLPPLLQLLSDQQLTAAPQSVDEQLRLLVDYLRSKRVLLVLDNLESILAPARAGAYRAGYEPYGQLIQQLATLEHKSHLLLTSREQPTGYGRLERDSELVQSLQVSGLDREAGHALLAQRGLAGEGDAESMLIARYSGNPLALKLVADTVDELFAGDIDGFLREESLVFDDIRAILDQQFSRISPLEQELLFWLVVEREPTSVSLLRKNLLHSPPQRLLVEALQGLQRRSLIERHDTGFTLQNVIFEYLSDKLIEIAGRELETGQLNLLHRHALLKAQSKAYVRQSQARLLLIPLGEHLLKILGRTGLQTQLQQILAMLRNTAPPMPSYAGGNILNLLLQLGIDVSVYDFSRLKLWQIYLQGLNLPAIDLTATDLTGARFSDNFSAVCAVAYSPDGKLFALGTVSGEIRVWQTDDHTLAHLLQGHEDAVWALAFSPDSRTIASGSGDQTVRLWDVSTEVPLSKVEGLNTTVSTGQVRHILSGHDKSIGAVAFSPDGLVVASGSGDKTVRVWDVQQGTLRHLLDKTGWVVTLAFSPQMIGGHYLLASGGEDRVVQLWALAAAALGEAANGITPTVNNKQPPDSARLIGSFQGHSHWIRAVAFSPDGKTLVSGSYDQTVRLWDVSTGQERLILTEHTNRVLTVAFSQDGQLIASAGRDRTVRLWDVNTGQIYRTLLGHTDWVRTVAFSADGLTLASGGYDQKLCFWTVATGQLERMTQGYSDPAQSIDFSPDGKTLASNGAAETVRLWDLATGRLRQTLRRHTNRVRCVAFGPQQGHDRQLLASGGYDNTIRLWELSTATTATPRGLSPASNPLASAPASRVLSGHTDAIQSIAFSPDGKLMASGSDDSTVCVWDVAAALSTLDGSSVRHAVLQGHRGRISSVAFCAYGQGACLLLASAGGDHSIRLWDISTEVPLSAAEGLNKAVLPPFIAASASGEMAATIPNNGATTSQRQAGRLRAILHEPAAGNRIIAFRPYTEGERPLLASGSYDGAIRLWDLSAICNPAEALGSDPDELDLTTPARLEATAKLQVWRILQLPTGRVRCLAFSPDGQSLVSGGTDRNIYVWDVASGELRQTLVGHTDGVLAVAFQPHADASRQLLASGSADESIKLWDLQSGTSLQTLRPPGLYAGMNITGVTGISAAQRAALKALGAVETVPHPL